MATGKKDRDFLVALFDVQKILGNDGNRIPAALNGVIKAYAISTGCDEGELFVAWKKIASGALICDADSTSDPTAEPLFNELLRNGNSDMQS